MISRPYCLPLVPRRRLMASVLRIRAYVTRPKAKPFLANFVPFITQTVQNAMTAVTGRRSPRRVRPSPASWATFWHDRCDSRD
jgi:hypothetical protein